MNISINKKKDFIWNVLGLTINAFNSLFFLIIVNRINGEVAGGVFTYAYSLICLFYIIGLFYTRTYQVSDVSGKYKNKDYIVSRAISCVMMFIITVITVMIFQYDTTKSIVIILLCLYRLIEAFADVFLGILQKEGFLYKAGFSLFIKGIVALILFMIVDYVTKDMILSCVTIVFVNLGLFLLYDLKNTRKYIGKEYSFHNAISILKNSFPVFVFSFLNIYLINSTKYILDFVSDATLQNIYGIILMPGTVLSLCAQYIINPYIVPLTDLFKRKKYNEFRRTLLKIIAVICFLGILCIIGAYILGIPVLNLIYGIELSKYKTDLLIIILGSIFVALIAVISSGLTILNKNYIQMYIYIFSSILSTVLGIVLINQFKVLGASLTYLIVMFVQFIITYIYYNRFIKKIEGVKVK